MRAFSLGLLLLLAAASGCDRNGSETATTKSSPPIQAGVRVEAATVQRAVLPAQTRVVGKVMAWRVSRVVSPIPGTLRKRAVENGSVVKDGAPLFWLDASRLLLAVETAKVGLAARVSERAYAEAEHQRLERLVAKGAASQFQLDQAAQSVARARIGEDQANVQLRSAKRQLADATIASPQAGIVHQVMADVGDAVAPGVPLAEVVDLSRVKIRAGVRGQVVSRLSPGQEVPFVVGVLNGEVRQGTLATVAPRADPRTGLFDVELHADNPDGALKGGMTATFAVDASTEPTLLVPSSALTRRQDRIGVFVIRDSKARFFPVVTGQRSQGFVEVLDGIDAGAQVAITGLNALAEGAEVIVTTVAPPLAPAAAATSQTEAPAAEATDEVQR